MRTILVSVAGVLLLTGTTMAQSLPPGGSSTAGTTFWAGAEYLVWWIRPGPIVPLVTTGNPTDAFPGEAPSPGALGLPGTRVLFGDESLDYGSRTGARFNVGGWMDEGSIGVEGSLFYLNSQVKPAYSVTASDQVVSIPVLLTDAGRDREGIFTVSDPLFGSVGGVDIYNTSRLWGLETNVLVNLTRAGGITLNAFGGFRYLDLLEKFVLGRYTENGVFGFSTTSTEDIRARTQFYGGQVGAQADVQFTRFFASLRGAVAVGTNQQYTALMGTTTATGLAAGDGPFVGGVFTQPTNIGLRRQSKFAVVPQVGLKAGLNILDGLRLSVGYDFLYWTEVVRPGSQIDRSINPTQRLGGDIDTGPARPAAVFNTTSFWAHGLNFAAELRF